MKVNYLIILLFIYLLLGCSESTVEMSSTQLRHITENINPNTRTLVFRYEVTNKANKLLTNVNVRIAAPVLESQRHSIDSLDINTTYKLEVDKLGNQTILIDFDSFAPFSTQVVTVKVKLVDLIKEEIKEPSADLFLSESALVPFSNVEFSKVNQLIKGESDLITITQAYHWVNSHMSYSGYLSSDYGALYALRKGRGDCTEYMYLLAALLRANNISTRLVAGYVYPGDHLVDASDYHNWVEVFHKDKWQVVDALKERLLDNSMDYVVMRYLDSDEGYIHESQKFSSSDVLSIKML